MAGKRLATISAVCYQLPDPDEDHPPITKAGNLEKARRMMETAGERKSDLIVFPELFATKHTGIAAREAAEPVPEGEICQVLAEGARSHNMYVAGCLYQSADDKVYNTVALFDRRGELVGTFSKVHLPPEETKIAVPGSEYPVWETDFGRVGALVCYDLLFPEAARCLALGGADIILWPTMFSQPRAHYADILMRARAIENRVYLVCSNYAQPCMDATAVHIGRSAIVDWDGEVLADTGRREGVATATVDLAEPRAAFGSPQDILAVRRPDTYGAVVEPH